MLTLTSCGGFNYAPVMTGVYHPPRAGKYLIQPGDTLYSIAFAYGLDFRTLARINHIQSPYQISPGQYLIINPRVSPALYPIRHRISLSSSLRKRSQIKIRRPVLSRAIPPEQRLGPISRWHWPAVGKIINYYAPANGNKGIDISGKYGSPIFAAAKGVVVYAGAGLRAYGNLIIIKHNERFLTAYAYTKIILVHEGQQVQGGQEIAEMGHSGTSKTQLHFEIRLAGKPVNPLNYLPRL